MTKLAPEWVRTSDPVIRSPARYRWTTAPASVTPGRQTICIRWDRWRRYHFRSRRNYRGCRRQRLRIIRRNLKYWEHIHGVECIVLTYRLGDIGTVAQRSPTGLWCLWAQLALNSAKAIPPQFANDWPPVIEEGSKAVSDSLPPQSARHHRSSPNWY